MAPSLLHQRAFTPAHSLVRTTKVHQRPGSIWPPTLRYHWAVWGTILSHMSGHSLVICLTMRPCCVSCGFQSLGSFSICSEGGRRCCFSLLSCQSCRLACVSYKMQCPRQRSLPLTPTRSKRPTFYPRFGPHLSLLLLNHKVRSILRVVGFCPSPDDTPPSRAGFRPLPARGCFSPPTHQALR